MKNISLVLLAFVLTLTFTASDIVNKGNKPEALKKCPYLESLRQNNSQLECPFLNGVQGGELSCPFLNQNGESQTGCPYLDGGGSCTECPYLKQHDREEVKQIETHPLPEGRNT
ncbi:MAG TPA: hypothetical protein VLB50_04770 [Ignavibacteriaceae bacterium]|nr:hypothetical protein [Ignavibacteriaceae bacterium]